MLECIVGCELGDRVSPGDGAGCWGRIVGSSLDSRERDAAPCEQLTESWEDDPAHRPSVQW